MVVKVGREVHRLQMERRQLVDEVRDLRALYARLSSFETVQKRTARELGFASPPLRILEVED